MEPNEILKALAAPMAYKWKIQGWTKLKDKAICVAYIDSRDVQQRFDDVCGLYWSDDVTFTRQWDDMIEYKGSITIDMPEFKSTRSDTGSFKTESYNHDMADKGSSSDAFKRAAVKFGVGRFLYDLDVVYITAEEYESKKYNLTEFINENKIKKPVASPVQFATDVQKTTFISRIKNCKTLTELKSISEEAKGVWQTLPKATQDAIINEADEKKKKLTLPQ